MSEAQRDPRQLSSPIKLKIASDPANLAAVRHAVETLASSAGFDATAVGQIGLCVNEAMANVIRHAYDGASDRPIVVSAVIERGAPSSQLAKPQAAAGGASASCGANSGAGGNERIVIAIRDWGNGVNPATLPPSPARHDVMTPGGVGMICLESWMDSIAYTPQPDGMLLTMTRAKMRRSTR